MANGVETVLIASLLMSILNTGVSTGALESATLTVLCVWITFPMVFPTKSEPSTSGSFSVSDEALKGRYKKS